MRNHVINILPVSSQVKYTFPHCLFNSPSISDPGKPNAEVLPTRSFAWFFFFSLVDSWICCSVWLDFIGQNVCGKIMSCGLLAWEQLFGNTYRSELFLFLSLFSFSFFLSFSLLSLCFAQCVWHVCVYIHVSCVCAMEILWILNRETGKCCHSILLDLDGTLKFYVRLLSFIHRVDLSVESFVVVFFWPKKLLPTDNAQESPRSSSYHKFLNSLPR